MTEREIVKGMAKLFICIFPNYLALALFISVDYFHRKIWYILFIQGEPITSETN